MKFYVFVLAIGSIVTSCVQNNFVEIAEYNPGSSYLDSCLRQNLADYFDNEKKILELMQQNHLLLDSRTGFSELFYQLQLDTCRTMYSISDDELSSLEFAASPILLQIYLCAICVEKDSILSNNQKEFYSIFSNAGKSGAFDPLSISEIIQSMDDKEFYSCAVREVSLFYGFNFYFRNNYNR